MMTTTALTLAALARPAAQRLAPASARLVSTSNMAGSKKSSVHEPSYFYAPPGSSLREPMYLSLSDPVYFYDAGKSSRSDANPPAPQQQQQPSSPGPQAQQQPSSRLPLAALTGSPHPPPKDTRPHAYRMSDDLAQQTYTVSARFSMREPHYVSVNEPIYVQADK